MKNYIKLESTETSSGEFELDSGRYIIAAAVATGGTFPTGDIVLQMRFEGLEWITISTLNATTKQATFWANNCMEYQIVAANAGATVVVGELEIDQFSYRRMGFTQSRE